MRWTGGTLAAAIVLGSFTVAHAYQPGCADCNRTSRPDLQFGDLSGPPCSTPCGYARVPGCCEPRRPCCQNAWDGYCEHRAKLEAHGSRGGAPKSHYRHYSSTMRRAAASQPACDQATDGVRPTPAAIETKPLRQLTPDINPAPALTPPAPPVRGRAA